MSDFSFPFEVEKELPKKAKVTSLIIPEPTPEEWEQMMDEFYNEIYQGFWRKDK